MNGSANTGSPNTISSDFVTGDGCRIAYRMDGQPGAPMLLLSNSLGTSVHMWDGQLPAWTEHFHVLRYDTRGHGMSDAPPGAYSMDRLGSDVIELLDFLAVRSVHFCGLSMGGMVGQWLGVRAPDRIDKLVLCNTSAYMGPPSNWNTRISTVQSQGMAAIADAVVSRWFTPAFQTSGGSEVDRIRTMLLATSAQGYTGCCAAIRDMDMRKMNALIHTPTLVIAGNQDTATPLRDSESLARAVQNAQLIELHAAHLSNVEQGPLFTQTSLEFLTAKVASPSRVPLN